MDQEHRDVTNRSPLTEEAGPQSHSDIETAPLAEQAPLDARALVVKMIDAGEWPEPELLEQIAARRDEAVEPLIAILRSKPRGWPAEAPLDHARSTRSATWVKTCRRKTRCAVSVDREGSITTP
jgi:hypothetical protein